MAEERKKDEHEKTEEKTNIDKGSFTSGSRRIFSNIWESKLIKKFRTEANARPFELIIVFVNVMLVGVTLSMACSTKQLAQDNRDLVKSNLKLIDYTRQSNERAEQLFVGQNRPLIDVAPISITQVSDDGKIKMAKTKYSIVNYSGFPASNIAIDLVYVSNVWISEWLKADYNKRMGKLGVVIGKEYFSIPEAPPVELIPGVLTSKILIQNLVSGDRKKAFHVGQFDLDIVRRAKFKGHKVLVRVTWENDKGYIFDEIHQYNLLCTESVQEKDSKLDSGLSFTFIPEGVISQKKEY
ncbi:MAG: hypothetical protein GY774_17090 [Planctomycetes bacterium]|nr:hypothetical protein [Planctomycetota bacterium]